MLAILQLAIFASKTWTLNRNKKERDGERTMERAEAYRQIGHQVPRMWTSCGEDVTVIRVLVLYDVFLLNCFLIVNQVYVSLCRTHLQVFLCVNMSVDSSSALC